MMGNHYSTKRSKGNYTLKQDSHHGNYTPKQDLSHGNYTLKQDPARGNYTPKQDSSHGNYTLKEDASRGNYTLKHSFSRRASLPNYTYREEPKPTRYHDSCPYHQGHTTKVEVATDRDRWERCPHESLKHVSRPSEEIAVHISSEARPTSRGNYSLKTDIPRDTCGIGSSLARHVDVRVQPGEFEDVEIRASDLGDTDNVEVVYQDNPDMIRVPRHWGKPRPYSPDVVVAVSQ